MIRNRILLKAFAVFLLLETASNVIAPPLVLALTSGPTAPEASSFEPVDTTDMVNLVTGDLAYSVPLIEVPGPAGGYPLALSYHAGIQPNLDASWVGLGFSLNPGAINRSVSGYADDYSGVTGSDRTFWEGGESSSVTVGVTIGLAGNSAGVSAGLTFAEDTYKGVGVGHYFGLSANEKGSIGRFGQFSSSASYQTGVSPYGQSYSSSGLSVGVGAGASAGPLAAGAFGGASITNNGASAGLSGGLSANGPLTSASIGASISTSSPGAVSASAGTTFKSVHNAKSGSISTHGYDYDVTIPTPLNIGIRLGKSYQRYWMDETANVGLFGSVYFPENTLTSAALDLRAFDVYDLTDVSKPLSESNPETDLAGSFIDYDSYQVVAQGVSGAIKPYHYTSYLLRQNNKNGDKYTMKSYPLGGNQRPSFRFVGDFSNRYLYNAENDQFQTSVSGTPISFQFNGSRTTGENGNDGFNEALRVLPGSKHVEWYTNAEIVDSPDFIDCSAPGFVRDYNNQIGGFKVTNESGVTYYFALPVYSFDEYTYSGKVDYKGKHSFNTYKKTTKYAYTWLLTAVTGPDYVDSDQDGYADRGDLGYWVSFEYGKWSSKYGWRNPAVGFNKDVDQAFNNFSKGNKEVYYLNAIRTETHTALFVKELRLDGKGVVHEFDEAVKTGSDHNLEDVDAGGFNSKAKTDVNGVAYTDHPVSSLRLEGIYLVKNEDLDGMPDLNSLGNIYYQSTGSVSDKGKNVYGQYVLDVHDANTASLKDILYNKSIRRIGFNVDYSLCPSTVNSFVSEVDVINTSASPSSALQGKLTLKSLRFYGKASANLLPDIQFRYDEDVTFSAVAQRQIVSSQLYFDLTVGSFGQYDLRPGDIIRYENKYYGYITETNNSSGIIRIKPIDGDWTAVSASFNGVFSKTKNPPFKSDFFDLWGMYKVDYQNNVSSDPLGFSENVKRRTTALSARSVDVWSLREITSPVGAKVRFEFESDQYNSAIKSLSNILIKNIESDGNGGTRVTLYEDLDTYGLSEGDLINMRFATAVRYDIANPGAVSQNRFSCNGVDQTYTYKWIVDDALSAPNPKVEIDNVSGNSFTIEYNFLNRYPATGPGTGSTCLEEAFPYSQEHSSPQNASSCIGMQFLTQSAPVFLGGEVLTDEVSASYGGDLRVKSVSLEQFEKTRTTYYTYENGVTSYEPMGFAVPIQEINSSSVYDCIGTLQQQAIQEYRDLYVKDVYNKFQYLFANSRELPSPGVLYEKVIVKDNLLINGTTTVIPGRSEYLFEVFSPKTVDVSGVALGLEVKKQFDTGSVLPNTNFSRSIDGLSINGVAFNTGVAIKDFSSIMGSLKSVTLYDEVNNKVSETRNHYLHDNFNAQTFDASLHNLFKDQGKLIETFADSRIILNPEQPTPGTDYYTLAGILSQKIRYPSIQTGQTVTNYRTGITTTSANIGFDFYSGQVTKSLSSDGYGRSYVTESIPAYRKYSAMGLAYVGGKNMLMQSASSYTYSVNSQQDYEKQGLVSASVDTWSDAISSWLPGVSHPATQAGIWRKDAHYSFIGNDAVALTANGLYPLTNGNLPEFTAWQNATTVPDGWQKDSEVTLYDGNSHALEALDINGDYAATRMLSDQTRVMATIGNARYNEFGSSGVEDFNAQGISGNAIAQGDGVISTTFAHTGLRSLSLGAGKSAFQSTLKVQPKQFDRKMHISFWAYQPSVQQLTLQYQFSSGQSMTSPVTQSIDMAKTRRAGNWVLCEVDIPVNKNSISANPYFISRIVNTGSGVVYLDDYRVHPDDAAMVSYVYNQWDELSHILNSNNLYTEYRYDGMGRLTSTYVETFQEGYGNYGVAKTKDILYNYGRSNTYTVSITATSTGGNSGNLSPLGVIPVAQGSDITFGLNERCSESDLLNVYIDNVPLNLNLAETTLFDGTKVRVQGNLVTFKGVLTNHTLSAQFQDYGVGIVECHVAQLPTGSCFDGTYDYRYYDACGVLGEVFHANTKADIPANLRGLAPFDNCKVLNGPTPCDNNNQN